MSQPVIPTEIRERINAAADALYEQSGRQSLPKVADVRRDAKVDMAMASAVMRDWKKAQLAPPIRAVVNIPDAISAALAATAAEVWGQAQDLANEALRSAQTAWEEERETFESMRTELSGAFENQAAELAAVQEDCSKARTEVGSERKRADAADDRVAEIERRFAEVQASAKEAIGGANSAREESASLSGQLQAVKEQNAALLAELSALAKSAKISKKA